MIALTLLWVVLAIAEGFTYRRVPVTSSRRRDIWLGLLMVALLLSTGVRLWASWHAWAIFCLLALYRVANIARFWKARLQVDRLRAETFRSHIWLVILQAGVLAVGSAVARWHLGYQMLAGLSALQLLAAAVLLRSTIRTWRHAEPFSASQPMTDRELPTLSVLVPARDETDALQRCLEHLVASNYPKLEIIVLDDNSTTRRTPEIIRSFASSGVRFVRGTKPDEKNWLPKNQAYAQLRFEASGELLLFIGVDTLVEPDSLRRLVEVMQQRQKDMMSVLPQQNAAVRTHAALLQPMRYYWELCLPRRFFKRPPVLGACWLIRAAALDAAGGFGAVQRSVTPEAYFARVAVTTDAYSFIRSNAELGISLGQPAGEQYDISARLRYPQLHRRLELVAVTTLAELTFLLAPEMALFFTPGLTQALAWAALWAVSTVCLLVTYYFAAVATKLNNPFLAWLLMPCAFAADIVLQHVSMYRYEFGRVNWKGRDAVLPVMRTATQAKRLP